MIPQARSEGSLSRIGTYRVGFFERYSLALICYRIIYDRRVRSRYRQIKEGIPQLQFYRRPFTPRLARRRAITSNLNRLRLARARYWPIGNSFFFGFSRFSWAKTLVDGGDLRRPICRDGTHGANWAPPLEYLTSLISAVECLPGFYQPLLPPYRASYPRLPVFSLSSG